MPAPTWQMRFRAAALIVAAAVAASAQGEQSAGERYYATRLAKLLKSAATRLWSVAAQARSASLYRFARDEARRVLDLDPDNLPARQFLGYVKRGEVWDMDLAQSGKLPTENLQPPVGPKLADSESSWRAVAAKADLDVAAMYAQLGDECASKGFRVEGAQAYEKALSIDADCAPAHKGLGQVKLAEGLWMTPDAGRALEAAKVVRPIVETSRMDELFEAKFAKAESGHFRVESPNPPQVLEGYLDSCERAYAAYFADLMLDPSQTVLPRTPLFLVLEDGNHWDRWINRMVRPEKQGFFRALTCQWSRDERWACALRNHEGDTDTKRRDRLAHQTVHMLNFAVWDMPSGCWLDDALAYRYPMLLNGATCAFCLAPHKEDYARASADRNWTDSSAWRSLLKEVVAKNDDIALRMVVARNAFELPLYASVKAWSVVDFLIRRDRDAFVGMLRELKDENARKDLVSLLETRFGKDVESLDDEWRRWVLATY